MPINNIFILISIFAIILLMVVFSIYYFLKRKFKLENELIQAKKYELDKSLTEAKSLTAIQFEEKEKFEIEKKKTQEKNKKIWEMSETVYKEKKKVEEQVEVLQQEKEKLEAEKKKVDEKVKKLWSQSMAIHKEKERINEIKEDIEIKHREVMDSVNYAKRIQEAILPSISEISDSFPNSFVLFKPKHIVSGDFYWFSKKDEKTIIASVDCTGHGVPGAFMSVIGNTLLNQIVNEKGITDPAEILGQLNKEVNHSLHQTQTGSESRDGMDIAICCFEETILIPNYNKNNGLKFDYAGANRSLYHIKNNEFEETKADKFPIGGLEQNDLKKFTTHSFELKKNETIYISTDGFADQFGQNNKKLKTKKFKDMLLSIQNKSMEEQKKHLDSFIENWRGEQEQTDDILIIGIRA